MKTTAAMLSPILPKDWAFHSGPYGRGHHSCFSTFQGSTISAFSFNPLPPSGAVRKHKIYILEDLFSSVLSQFKKYLHSRNLKFNNVGIF